MFTDDKITEIFCLADDFCKFFDSQVKKYTLTDLSGSENKRKYHREPTMSKVEIMLIMILPKIRPVVSLLS